MLIRYEGYTSVTMKVLAIIPAYNEEESIDATVTELVSVAPDVDYVVVNDGSRDGTAALCRQKGYPMIDLPVNLGLTAAFQTGMKYAYRKGYDYAVQFDADGQHRPEFIRMMVDAAVRGGAGIVVGSRFVEKEKGFSARMAGSALISSIIRMTTGRKITDPTSGMRLYDKTIIERFAKGHDFAPEPDTVAYLARCGTKVCEIQVDMRDRTAGESYLSFTKSISYMARTCASILFLQWFR